MIKRSLFAVVCALMILPLVMDAQQKKHTYYVRWDALNTSTMVMFTSAQIIKVETDSVWSKEGRQKREKDFRNALPSIVSDSDFKALGGAMTAWIRVYDVDKLPSLRGYNADKSLVDNVFEMTYDALLITKDGRQTMYGRGALIYSIEYRYTPRDDERVTYLNPPLSPTACPPYTRGIIADLIAARKSGIRKGKYTYYLLGGQSFLQQANVYLVSQQIAKVESDRAWSVEDQKKMNPDFQAAIRGLISPNDLGALGDSSIVQGGSVWWYNADYYTSDDIIRLRNSLLKNVLKKYDGAVIYSVDYRYKPRQGETATYLNPLPAVDYPLYTKGSVAKKLGR